MRHWPRHGVLPARQGIHSHNRRAARLAGCAIDIAACISNEQAPAFSRLGAGIQMSPNAMKVLRAIGLEPALRAFAFQPPSQKSREWDTGELHLELEMGAVLEGGMGRPISSCTGATCMPNW